MLYQRVPSRQVPICPSYTFAVECIAFAYHKTQRGKTSRGKGRRDVSWVRESGVHWSCYVLLFTDFVNFGQSCLSGLDFGAFINSTRWIGSCVPAVRQLVTETGLKPYVVGSTVRSAITATAEFHEFHWFIANLLLSVAGKNCETRAIFREVMKLRKTTLWSSTVSDILDSVAVYTVSQKNAQTLKRYSSKL